MSLKRAAKRYSTRDGARCPRLRRAPRWCRPGRSTCLIGATHLRPLVRQKSMWSRCRLVPLDWANLRWPPPCEARPYATEPCEALRTNLQSGRTLKPVKSNRIQCQGAPATRRIAPPARSCPSAVRHIIASESKLKRGAFDATRFRPWLGSSRGACRH